jgi:hypothetical protein
MNYSFARVGAALGRMVEDTYTQNRWLWARLREKGGKRHAMPCHHNSKNISPPISTATSSVTIQKGPLVPHEQLTIAA